MDKIKISKLLSIIISLSGFIVMIGWVMDIELLKSIVPTFVTMKFTTAFSFFLSGIILYFVSNSTAPVITDLSQMILSFAILINLLLMVTLLVSSILNIRTGIEDFLVFEQENAIQTITPGRPSLATILNFILVSIIGLIKLNDLKYLHRKIYILGIIITAIGIISILGYVFNFPILYFSIEGYSTAMAIHTATLFIILGIGFWLYQKHKTKIKYLDAERTRY